MITTHASRTYRDHQAGVSGCARPHETAFSGPPDASKPSVTAWPPSEPPSFATTSHG